MTPRDLADALEGRREGHEWCCRCPVHGGRSLSVAEKNGRLLLTCRAGCPQSEVIKALREMGLWGTQSDHDPIPPPVPEPQSEKEKRIKRAERTWEGSCPITPGDPVHKYLTGRGIVPDAWPEDLRTHPHLDYWEVEKDGKPVRTGIFPAMLAVVRNPHGRPVALHRTYLTEDGHKAPVPSPKKIMKVYDLAGSSVRLFTPRDGVLAVCEGVEDALSAWVLWKIPAWATIGTSGLKGFVPPEDVREILILADNDEPGKRAALDLARRLEEIGKAVRIRIPSGQKDINALLMEGVTHAFYH